MNELEREVMRALLDGPGEELAILRQQAARATIASREHTGVGFYTNLAVPDDVPQLSIKRRFHLGDIAADVQGVEHGVLFILWGENGRIECLEGSTYTGTMPADPHLIKWQYLVHAQGRTGALVPAASRDMSGVYRNLAG